MHYPSLGISIRKTQVGRGVFAMRSFHDEELIGKMRGVVIETGDYDPSYVVSISGGGVLEPSAPFRFLNHCCEPNAELLEETKTKTRPTSIWVAALRPIRRGEQITIDYAWPAEEAAIRCLCGAPSCRGWVVAKKQLGRLERLQRRLLLQQAEAERFAPAAE